MADEEGQLQEPKPIDEKLQKLLDKAFYAGDRRSRKRSAILTAPGWASRCTSS